MCPTLQNSLTSYHRGAFRCISACCKSSPAFAWRWAQAYCSLKMCSFWAPQFFGVRTPSLVVGYIMLCSLQRILWKFRKYSEKMRTVWQPSNRQTPNLQLTDCHKVVYVVTHFKCGGIFNDSSLHVYCWVWQWKNFENRSIFAGVMGNSVPGCFFMKHGVEWNVHIHRTIASRSVSTQYIQFPSVLSHRRSSDRKGIQSVKKTHQQFQRFFGRLREQV